MRITRRDLVLGLAASVLMLAGAGCQSAAAPTGPALVKFGVVTDLHYANIDPVKGGTRYYRDSIPKLRGALAVFRAEEVDFVVELGDFKDQVSPPLKPESKQETATLEFLKKIDGELREVGVPTWRVLGNHDMDSISKEQFFATAPNPGAEPANPCRSFTNGGIRFIILDANHNPDGSDYCKGNYDWRKASVPPAQLAWLEAELKSAAKNPVIIFLHQPLDADLPASQTVANAAEVRKLLEAYGKVLAVFTGHEHAGHYSFNNGIHYCTMRGMIEMPYPETAFSVIEILPNLTILVHANGREIGRELHAGKPGRELPKTVEPAK
jgi:alkaline phosphatase